MLSSRCMSATFEPSAQSGATSRAGSGMSGVCAVNAAEDEENVRREQARAVGMFRYGLIRDAADPGLSPRERGRMVRALAAKEHIDPMGRSVRYSRDHLDRWIRRWRRGGFDALVPTG